MLNRQLSSTALESEKQPRIDRETAKRVLAALKANTQINQAIVTAIHNGELDGLNDSLVRSRFRRQNHRGKRAEEQSVSYLGEILEELGFEHCEVDCQFRFINRTDFEVPVCLIVVRANEIDDKFYTWKKGPRSQDLLNENKGQLVLFDFVETKAKSQSKLQGHEMDHPCLNIWLAVDASSEANKEMDGLKIHLLVPIDIIRNKNLFFAKRSLIVLERELLWEGTLGAPILSPKELPDAAPIPLEPLQERFSNDEGAS